MNSDFYIATDKNLLDIDFINSFMQDSYWGHERTAAQTETSIENSLCFGMYTHSDQQVGFARVVTDKVFFGYIGDVLIHQKYQDEGLGKRLMDFILNHEIVKNLPTLTLKTKDAHSFYKKFGFINIGDSAQWMAIDKHKLK